MYQLYIDIYVAMVCLLLGSFYNVVAIRLLKNESIAFPPSHCPSCNHRLGLFDLIPVLSYVFIRGKCRYCRTKISILYPIGELVSAIVLFALYKKAGLTLELIPAFLFGTALLLAVWTDIREKLILDKITYPLFIGIVISRIFIHTEPVWYYFAGAILIFIMLYIVAVASKGNFGGGDIKLFTLVGMMVGIEDVLLSLFTASLLGIIISAPFVYKYGRKTEIPFAPFILVGSLLVYLFSPYITLL